MLYLLGWAILSALGIAACLAGVVSVLVRGGHIEAPEILEKFS